MNSMTGFGRAEAQIGASTVGVEVKSVNHRYLDTRFRMPGFLSAFELKLRERIQQRFARGSFDVTIRHKLADTGGTPLLGTRYVLDEIAAKSVFDGLAKMAKTFGTEPLPSPDAFLANNRVLVPVDDALDLDKIYPEIEKLFDKALEQLGAMRASEGAKLQTILADGLEQIGRLSAELSTLAPKQPPKLAEKLKKRIEKWQAEGTLSTQPDTQRLELELALYAERSDFTEELDRLSTHHRAFGALLKETGPAGRRLDFLTQELHREFNTMGSKAALIDITQKVLAGKAEVEKLRQQVQNVE